MSEETETVEVEEASKPTQDDVIAGLQSQITEINQKLVDANEEAMRRRKANDRLKQELEQAKQTPPAETSNEEVVAQLKAQYETQLNDERSKRQQLVQKNALSELGAALLHENIISAGVAPLSLMAQSRIGFDENGNIRIMSADGSKPLAGSGSDGYATIGDLATELAASDTGQHFTRDAGVSGGGKPPASSDRRLGTKSVTRTQFNAMTQSERSSFFKDGGKVVNG